jgi:hypothetical protein
LASKPLLLGVCHGTTFTFLRATLLAEAADYVERGFVLNSPVTIFSWPSDGLKPNWKQILQGLQSWKYILDHPTSEYLQFGRIPAPEYY